MSLEVWHVGKKRKDAYEDLIHTYEKRIKRYVSIRFESIKDSKAQSHSQRKDDESGTVLQLIKPTDFLVLLDESGDLLTTKKFASRLNEAWMRERRVIFLIGGAYGVDDRVKSRANQILGLSKFVLPHQLARLVFTEQLYRAFTILNNENYHH